MAIPTKPPVNPGAPNNITNKSTSDPSAPNTVTTKAQPSPTVPNTVTTKATSGPSNPNTITNKAASSPGVPNTITTETALSPSTPNTVTTKAPAAVPRVCNPLVALNFGSESYAQAGQPIAFEDLFSYSRNTSATFINRRIDRLGRYEYFLDTDYAGNVENLVTYSEQFDNAAWTKTNSTVTANKMANPIEGKRDADLYEASSSGDLIQQSVSVTSGNDYNFSAYVKYNNESRFVIAFSAGFTVSVCTFDILTGQIVSSTGSAFNLSIEFIRDGWYRISAVNTATSTTSGVFRLASASGSGGEKFYLWGAQLTESSKPLPYVKTIASTVSQAFTESLRREYNPVTGEALGALIEGGSTNLAVRSEEFDNASWNKSGSTVSANEAIAPDLTKSMGKLLEDVSNGEHRVDDSLTVATGSVTLSVYAKAAERRYLTMRDNNTANSRAWFDLQNGTVGTNQANVSSASIKEIRDGVYRCSITVSAATTTFTPIIGIGDADNSFIYLGDGSSGLFIWGAQVEQQPFATSYIRTEGSTVSRSSDDLSLNASGNITGGGAEFSSFVEFDILGDQDSTSGQRMIISVDSAGSEFYQTAATGGGSSKYLQFYGSSPIDYNTSSDNLVSGNLAFTFKSDNILTTYLNGVTVNPSDAGNQFSPSLSGNIDIGHAASTSHLFGHIKILDTYDLALTAQEVALL